MRVRYRSLTYDLSREYTIPASRATVQANDITACTVMTAFSPE